MKLRSILFQGVPLPRPLAHTRLSSTKKPGSPKRPPAMKPPTAAQLIQPPPDTGQGSQESGQVRVRQHVNPLARRWSQPIALPPQWYQLAFEDPSLPLSVDLGVAKGRFLLKLAARHPTRNFLGLEIREPLVHQANRVAADNNLRNLFYVACNANVSLASVLADAPDGVMRDVFVQFCDPWFKKRHAKRRMVNASLVDDIFSALRKSADCDCAVVGERSVFMQSDVAEVAHEMRSLFDDHNGLRRVGAGDGMEVDECGWLLQNPLGLPTEREIAVLNKHGDVYRALYKLNSSSGESVPERNSAPT